MIRSVVSAPVAVILLPVRVTKRVAQMRFSTLLAIGTGAAAAFTAAKRLMDREDAVNELPEALQQPAARAQTSLVKWRGRLTQAMAEASEEEAVAVQQLRQEHLRKSGRLPD